YVDLKVIQQIVLSQKTDNRSRVEVVLVLSRLCRLRLNKECAFEALLSGIVFCSVQETSKMLLLTLHVCVQQAHVAFSSTPEHIVLTVQCNGSVQSVLYLCGTMCQHVEVRICSGSVHVARM